MGVAIVSRLMCLPVLLLATTAADAPALLALEPLQPGRWTLTSRDADFPARSLCVADADVFLRVRHQPVGACKQFVVANTPSTATVTYVCPGSGSGRTTVRVETPRLVQIETQGIARGLPYDNVIEARRIGECAALSMR
jgi:hypothetical protein